MCLELFDISQGGKRFMIMTFDKNTTSTDLESVENYLAVSLMSGFAKYFIL